MTLIVIIPMHRWALFYTFKLYSLRVLWELSLSKPNAVATLRIHNLILSSLTYNNILLKTPTNINTLHQTPRKNSQLGEMLTRIDIFQQTSAYSTNNKQPPLNTNKHQRLPTNNKKQPSILNTNLHQYSPINTNTLYSIKNKYQHSPANTNKHQCSPSNTKKTSSSIKHLLIQNLL